MRKISQYALSCLLLVSASFSFAEAASEQAKQLIQQKFSRSNAALKIESIEKSQINGFYNVQIDNGPLLYVSEDASYFFAGELYSFQGNRMVNLTDQDSSRSRTELLKEFNPAEMVIFSPKLPVKTKSYITVYTDVDCFYCQKLHKEVPELNARGIEVRYVAFPRAGVNSDSARKLVSAWCSDNPQEAITRLKNRQPIEDKVCDNPVAKQYQLGKRMGITGTPAIIFPDGTLVPGYRPAKDLANDLGVL